MDTHSSKPDMGDDDLHDINENLKSRIINVFDEEKEEIKWDGSEAECVVDDDAEEFENEFSGIKLKFTLNEEEKEYSADILKDSIKSRNDKLFKKKNIIRTIILAIIAVIFAVSFFLNYGTINIVMFAVCGLVTAFMWLLPNIYVRKKSLIKLFNGEYGVKIYPDEVEIEQIINGKSKEWVIPMDEKGEFAEINNFFVLKDREGRIFTIPIRAVEPSFIADVQGILEMGTKPFDY